MWRMIMTKWTSVLECFQLWKSNLYESANADTVVEFAPETLKLNVMKKISMMTVLQFNLIAVDLPIDAPKQTWGWKIVLNVTPTSHE